MGLKTEHRTIGEGDREIKLRTTQLPVMRAQALMARLVRLMSPGIAKITGGTELSIEAMGPALAELFGRPEFESEVAGLTRQILASTHAEVDGKMIPLDRDETINAAFAGNLPGLFSALRFALEVNFADFFEGARAALAAARPAPAAPPKAPNEASA